MGTGCAMLLAALSIEKTASSQGGLRESGFLLFTRSGAVGQPPILTMEPAPKILYSRAEAAEMLSISVSSLDVLIATGRLKAIRKGRRVLIHLSEIERSAAQEIPRIWPSRRERDKAETAHT